MARDLERQKAWVRAHRDRVNANLRASRKAWRLANPEKAATRDREESAQYRAKHPARLKAYYRAHYMANRDKRLEYARRYRAANLTRILEWNANRRARMFGGGGSHTEAEWLEKLTLFAGLCAYCGGAERIVKDHKTPITRGGTNAIANLIPACFSCNARKGRMTAKEFIQCPSAAMSMYHSSV